MEVNYGAIDTDNPSCRGHYIIKFSSSPYNFQAELTIDGQVIFSGKMLCEGTYFFPINNINQYYDLHITKSINKIISSRRIINSNVNVICYYSKCVVPLCLRSISHSY